MGAQFILVPPEFYFASTIEEMGDIEACAAPVFFTSFNLLFPAHLAGEGFSYADDFFRFWKVCE